MSETPTMEIIEVCVTEEDAIALIRAIGNGYAIETALGFWEVWTVCE